MALHSITLERYSFITHLRNGSSCSSPSNNNVEICFRPYQKRIRSRHKCGGTPARSVYDIPVATHYGIFRCRTNDDDPSPFELQAYGSNNIRKFPLYRYRTDHCGSSTFLMCLPVQRVEPRYIPSRIPAGGA